MIIHNKADRIIIVPIPTPKDKRMGIAKPIRIMPGVNDIPDDIFNKIEPTIKRKIESKIFIVYQKKEKGNKKSISFTRLKDEAKIQLINNCADYNTLTKWRKISSSEEIRLAIANRIDEIKPLETPKKKNKKKEILNKIEDSIEIEIEEEDEKIEISKP